MSAVQQFPQPPQSPSVSSTMSLTIGHKTGETSERVGMSNQVKVTTSYQTFSVAVQVPGRGAAHPAITCPVCDKKLRVTVPSADTRRRWTIMVIAAMVACILAGVGILVGAEDFTEGSPFAALVLLVLAEIALINLLIFVEEKSAWVMNTNHKPM